MNFLTINLSPQSLQAQTSQSISQIAASASPSLDNATIVRDEIGQMVISGTFNGVPVWQTLYIPTFPVLVIFNTDTTNFRAVTDIKEVMADELILDLFYE